MAGSNWRDAQGDGVKVSRSGDRLPETTGAGGGTTQCDEFWVSGSSSGRQGGSQATGGARASSGAGATGSQAVQWHRDGAETPAMEPWRRDCELRVSGRLPGSLAELGWWRRELQAAAQEAASSGGGAASGGRTRGGTVAGGDHGRQCSIGRSRVGMRGPRSVGSIVGTRCGIGRSRAGTRRSVEANPTMGRPDLAMRGVDPAAGGTDPTTVTRIGGAGFGQRSSARGWR